MLARHSHSLPPFRFVFLEPARLSSAPFASYVPSPTGCSPDRRPLLLIATPAPGRDPRGGCFAGSCSQPLSAHGAAPRGAQRWRSTECPAGRGTDSLPPALARLQLPSRVLGL
ncbi:hypothetical protein PAHAL_8G036400 [Panicum hallii]|uniref:Uncharacterized protein n=1 Tax=Panicum hallii TaxID=206008 RepID=A0A2T8I7I3_9POAL|nr:hypothetical protein PAHAL_8G036400 [Panicum hallii]